MKSRHRTGRRWRRTLEGQTHQAAPEALTLVLVEFFAA
jgi:hypothetical protein